MASEPIFSKEEEEEGKSPLREEDNNPLRERPKRGRPSHHTLHPDILEGKLWQQLLIFFFPLLLGTFFQTLYNTADAMIVGRFVGKIGLSAVGGAPALLINLIIGFFLGMSTGTTVIIAQYYGARKEREISLAVHTTIGLGLLFGGIMLLLCLMGAPAILVRMNTPKETLSVSILYLRLYALGMPFQMLYNMSTGLLRGIGDSRRPTLYLVVSILTNIALDLFFVVGLQLGVAGAAIATVLSQGISAGLSLWYLTHTREEIRLNPRQISIDRGMLRKILSIGLPAGIRSTMYSFSNLIIQGKINGFGTDTVAAWAAWSKTDALYWMISNSLGSATTTIAGQNFGAGKFGRVRQCTREAFVLGVFLTALISIPLYLYSGSILKIFIVDPSVLAIGTRIGRYMSPLFILWLCIEIFSAILVGMGNATVPTLITILGVCCLRILWTLFIVPLDYRLNTVLFNYPLTWGVTSIAFTLYYFYYIKKHPLLQMA